MPVLRVNSAGGELQLHRSDTPALAALCEAARAGAGPAIVMLHGYSFRPGKGRDCPHEHIFALENGPCRKARSWPRALGIGDGSPEEGLALAFGWNASGKLWDAYGRAAEAGRTLARAVAAIRAAAPGRAVHVIAHSLGARVAFQALSHLEPGDIGRVITLNAAEYAGAAQAALARGAGPRAEVFAVSGGENRAYDFLFERLVAPGLGGDRALGRAPLEGPGRIALRLDRADVAERLAALGFPLAARRRRICHWSPYLRGGTMTLYSALMRQAGALPAELFRMPAAEKPARAPALPLPMGRKAPS